MAEKSCQEKPEQKAGAGQESRRVLILLAASLGLTMVVGAVLYSFFGGLPFGFTMPYVNLASFADGLFFVVVVAAAVYIGVIGLKELVVERRFSVEFLMAVAGLGAVYLRLFFEAATVLFLYSLAEYFEGYIQDRARRTLEKLSSFMPDKARVRMADGTEASVNVGEVQVGMIILVKPSERIPLDGNVVEGSSQVDQALVTGESVPVAKGVGDCVFAGTLNTGGVLCVEVTKKADETLVSKIVKLVVESGKRKASIETLVNRFAKVYVPIVILLAAFTALGLPLLLGEGSGDWLYRSLILLVVACPSAFIVSVPATIFVAITIAAKRGVIIKGGVFVEKLAQVKRVVFDKTGTLTLGKPIVHEVRPVEEAELEALTNAAALSQFSNHPVSKAIVRKAIERGVDISSCSVTDVTEIPGEGIVGFVNGIHVAVGNLKLMEEQGCDCRQAFEVTQGDIHTAVCVSVGKTGLAAVCVVDEVRDDAERAINALKADGLKTTMLTGDRVEIAKETAELLKIDEYYAELFPEDKLKCIEEMKGKDGLIIMVGDGVNDAPALAASDVGIAMGAAGVDVALESADVVLVKDELAQVPYLVRLSEKTMTIARQNIAASLAIKLILGLLGFAGLVPLWFTVASGDDGVTMLLLLNTLRLERLK
jgi:Cd2+/Zn2+-exporting ATPase